MTQLAGTAVLIAVMLGVPVVIAIDAAHRGRRGWAWGLFALLVAPIGLPIAVAVTIADYRAGRVGVIDWAALPQNTRLLVALSAGLMGLSVALVMAPVSIDIDPSAAGLTESALPRHHRCGPAGAVAMGASGPGRSFADLEAGEDVVRRSLAWSHAGSQCQEAAGARTLVAFGAAAAAAIAGLAALSRASRSAAQAMTRA